jgi:hypothetical protein
VLRDERLDKMRDDDVANSVNVTTTHHQHQSANDSIERYHVAKFDFAYVDTPLLVALWILFASAAKVGG